MCPSVNSLIPRAADSFVSAVSWCHSTFCRECARMSRHRTVD